MLAQHFAMIPRNDQEGGVIQLKRLELLDNLADAVVGKCDFTGIKVVGKIRGKRLRWAVVQMGIVVVQEQEGFMVFVVLKPVKSDSGRFITFPFVTFYIFIVLSGCKGVIIRIEPLGQTAVFI